MFNGDRREKEPAFFNVTMVNGHFAHPVYKPMQAFMGELVLAIERANPDFAWVQFVFKQVNQSGVLLRLKRELLVRKRIVEGDVQHPLYKSSTWHVTTDERAKVLDELAMKQQVVLGIQGMWVGDRVALGDLPFNRIGDAIDRLDEFVYSDPRLLLELVNRRFVEDLSPWARLYGGARNEPPSFLITPEDLPYYVHFPCGKFTDSTGSLDYTMHSELPALVHHVALPRSVGGTAMKIVKVPKLDLPLDEAQAAMLSNLATSKRRSWEFIYAKGKGRFVIFAEDDAEYVLQLQSIYGLLDLEVEPLLPPEAARALLNLGLY